MSRPYSETAVELAVAAIVEANWTSKPPGSLTAEARAVLDALAAAGLLLPEGAETRTEWGWDCGHPRAPEKTCVHPGPEDWARNTATQVWPGGALVSRWTAETPWRPVGQDMPREPLSGDVSAGGVLGPMDAVRLAVGDSKPSQDHDKESRS